MNNFRITVDGKTDSYNFMRVDRTKVPGWVFYSGGCAVKINGVNTPIKTSYTYRSRSVYFNYNGSFYYCSNQDLWSFFARKFYAPIGVEVEFTEPRKTNYTSRKRPARTFLPTENSYITCKDDRSEYGETNDCTVIALATALECSYKEAHQILERWGRRKRKGIPLDLTLQTRGKEIGITERMNFEKSPTLRQFIKDNPEGNFIVIVRGHALCVKNGVIYDHSERPQRRVLQAYRVK